jgi:predicted TIM-barrel fold metal-dependent hydrolase
MLEALREFPAQFRGIALIDPERSTEAHWRELVGNGVVGFRIDLGDFDETVAASAGFQRLCGFSREVGWLLDVHCQAAQVAAGANLLRATGLRVVIDHLGRPDVAAGLAGDAFAKVLEFGREGNALVKLSGAFRLSKAGPPYSDVDDYAGRVIEAFSIDNCLWGSDWPFVATDQHVDYGPMLRGVQRWLPHQSDQDKVLWTNPMRVFGFAPGPGIAEAVA